jgi:hypothetical protein
MAAYWLFARPYQLAWGASDQEITQTMPGDEVDPTPTFLATRAVTIEGTPAEIWPWLLQMGYGRAGFYGFDILENLGSPFGLGSAESIQPEFQTFNVGDKVPLSPVAEEVFYAVEPDRYLIWVGQTGPYPGSFTWALYPLDASHTRLVSRIRWTHHSISQPSLLSLDIFTEFTDHLAVRKILLGVAGRVEGSIEPAIWTNLEFFTYVFTALVFLAAPILILLRPLSWPGLLAALAAGVVWLLSWYAPIPWWAGVVLEIPVLIGFYYGFFRV